MLSAITLERVCLESYALLPKLFSTSSEKQFACSHSLLDFFTFLRIIQQWLLLDARCRRGCLTLVI